MKEKRAFYQWLYAVFPVIFLYSHNIEEVIPREVILPLISSVIAVFLLWGLFRLATKSPQKSALLAFLLFFMFFTYGHIKNIFDSSLSIQAQLTSYLIFAWIALFLGLMIFVLRTRRSLNTPTLLLNIFILVLFLFSLGKVILFHAVPVESPTPDHTIADTLPDVDTLNKNDLPDIYYLIFDRYAGAHSLKEYFRFDNKEFISYLEEKGFYMASDSHCNYPGTHLSVSSSLNMQYLNYLLREGPVQKRVIYRMLQDFKVWRLLKSAGYKYLHFGSWWGPTRINKHADVNFRGRGLLDLNQDFTIKLLESTMLTGLLKYELTASEERQLILETFEEIADVPLIEGPKFVFAHFLIPHWPYRFDANGEFLKPSVRKKRSNDENYINQLKFTNMKIMRLVSEILEKSSNPPIIIIQSDEGPREKDISTKIIRGIRNRSEKGRIRRMLRFNILNSYYLPGVDTGILYPHITPVNSFRIVFNQYFGTDFELLEDQNYFIDQGKKKIRKLVKIELR